MQTVIFNNLFILNSDLEQEFHLADDLFSKEELGAENMRRFDDF